MSDCRAFRRALSLIKVQTNNTSVAKDTQGSKRQDQAPLFYSITHLLPRRIKALDGANKLPHDIYSGLMDQKCAGRAVLWVRVFCSRIIRRWLGPTWRKHHLWQRRAMKWGCSITPTLPLMRQRRPPLIEGSVLMQGSRSVFWRDFLLSSFFLANVNRISTECMAIKKKKTGDGNS